MKIEGSKFLVTGGAGFIGSHLVKALLDKGASLVRVLDDLSTGDMNNIQIKDPKFEFIHGSTTNEADCHDAIREIDCVLHHAALGAVPRSIENPSLVTEVNVLGFVKLLNISVKSGVKKFIYASSSSIYGNLSPYASSKQANESFAKSFSEVYGINMIGLRYFNVFGPNQNPNSPYSAVIPKFIKQLMNHESPVIYGDGTQSRDFTYIDNVVDANLKAIMNDLPNSVIMDIACSISRSIDEIFLKIRDEIGKFDSSVLEIKPIYIGKRLGDIYYSCADIDEAKQWLHYIPSVKFEDGIKRTIEWYLKRKQDE